MAGETLTARCEIDDPSLLSAPATWPEPLRSNTLTLLPMMLAAAIVVGLIEAVIGYRLIHVHGLVDGDNYMRLVRIRDELDGGWLSHIVARDNGGAGTVVYWSHAIDALVLLVRLPMLLVLPGEDALYVAGAVTASLTAAVFAAILVWVPAPVVERRWLWTGPAMALFSPAVLTYGTLGNIHHHLPLAMTAVLATGSAGRAVTGRRDAAIWCGVWGAVGLWISPEALPYVLMPMAAIGVAWCLRPDPLSRCLTACGVAFAATVATAVLCDPPHGGWLSQEVDCNSIVYVVLALLICAAACLLGACGRYSNSAFLRALFASAVSSLVLCAWLWLYPDLTRGLSGLVPPSAAQAYFGSIGEMRRLQFNGQDISLLVSGALAMLAALALAIGKRSVLWGYAAACGLIVVALAASYIRFVVYAEAIAAMMLPIALQTASQVPGSPVLRRFLPIAVLAGFCLGPQLPAVTVGSNRGTDDIMGRCHLADIAPALRAEGNVVVLTEINDAPEILWRTPVRTVGSFYHRSIDAFMRARAAWRSLPEDGASAALATGATDVLACDFNGRPPLLAGLPPVTLQDRLMRHDVPPWLHEIASANGYHLYRIEHSTGD